jgi:hypothetical protein
MGGPPDGPPSIPLPRPLDRRLRLGPFPSARAALKFLSYAAAGALLAPFASPALWLPVLGLGFLLAVWRPDGVALDELAWHALAWRLRDWRGAAVTDRPPPAVVARSFVRVGPGRPVAIVRAYGTPLAYRPPADLQGAWEAYRSILRGLPGPVAIRSTLAPIALAPLLPRAPADTSRADGEAAAGYRELVTLLCRRRSIRRVDVTLFASGEATGAPPELEAAVRSLSAGLAGMGIPSRRLTGAGLAEAAREFGWRRADGAR